MQRNDLASMTSASAAIPGSTDNRAEMPRLSVVAVMSATSVLPSVTVGPPFVSLGETIHRMIRQVTWARDLRWPSSSRHRARSATWLGVLARRRVAKDQGEQEDDGHDREHRAQPRQDRRQSPRVDSVADERPQETEAGADAELRQRDHRRPEGG